MDSQIICLEVNIISISKIEFSETVLVPSIFLFIWFIYVERDVLIGPLIHVLDFFRLLIENEEVFRRKLIFSFFRIYRKIVSGLNLFGYVRVYRERFLNKVVFLGLKESVYFLNEFGCVIEFLDFSVLLVDVIKSVYIFVTKFDFSLIVEFLQRRMIQDLFSGGSAVAILFKNKF